jgi:hypothetical protein
LSGGAVQSFSQNIQSPRQDLNIGSKRQSRRFDQSKATFSFDGYQLVDLRTTQ